MSLILNVTSSGNSTDNEVLEHEFDKCGGTIGRRLSNAWVLPDENRHLSGSHATIEYEKGEYFIVDTSTNGVFINGSSKPLGRGNKQELEDGFQLVMGTFTINVGIKSKDQAEDVMPAQTGMSEDKKVDVDPEDIFADLVDDPLDDLDSLPSDEIPQALEAEEKSSIDIGSDDPFFDFGEFSSSTDEPKAASLFDEKNERNKEQNNISEFDSFFKPPSVETKPERMAQAEMPEITGNIIETPSSSPPKKIPTEESSGSVIPDDWSVTTENDSFDDLFAGIDDPFAEAGDPFALTEVNDFSKVEEPPENKRERETPPPRDKAVPPPRKKAAVSSAISLEDSAPSLNDNSESMGLGYPSDLPSGAAAAFIKGLGVDEALFNQHFSERELFLAGKLFKTALQGTMEVLQSRAEIKNEMRMDMTTIQPIQNNPIKFAVNANEALKKMFIQDNSSYMEPLQAMDEAFDDIKSHQVAVISGIQAGLVSVLKRFEPENLIERLEKESPISANIPIHRKAKLWDKFEDLYETIESEAEDDFNRLFGQEFAKAYDEQVAHLKKQRDE